MDGYDGGDGSDGDGSDDDTGDGGSASSDLADVIGILNQCQQINFSWAGLTINSLGFSQVAQDVNENTIRVTRGDNIPDGGTAMYTLGAHVITLASSWIKTNPDDIIKVVHESVHAIQDLQGYNGSLVDAEAAAFLGGALFAVYAGATAPPLDAFQAAAFKVAKDVYNNQGQPVPPSMMSPLKQLLMNDPYYGKK